MYNPIGLSFVYYVNINFKTINKKRITIIKYLYRNMTYSFINKINDYLPLNLQSICLLYYIFFFYSNILYYLEFNHLCRDKNI